MSAALLESLRGQVVTDVETAAKVLGRSKATGYRLAASGELPGVRRLGTRYVVVTAELLAWLGLSKSDAPTEGDGEGVERNGRGYDQGAPGEG